MINIKALNKTYGRRRGDNRVLRDVTLSLPDTGFVCILGPSGCGKTSLLNAIGGLDTFDSGTISIGDVSTNRYGKALFEAERNRNFGYIFQNYYLLPEHSVGYNIYLGLHSLQLSHEEKLDRVEEALRAVEMERYFHRNVSDLSGGQQQRVAIARALARKPRVIFADEPTGNLDEANTRNICALLRKISKTSLVVMVTHEQRIAEFFADRIIRLDNGVISGDSESFTRGSLTDSATLYTGDFAAQTLEGSGVRVRYYQQEDCGGVDVSILALKDRIIIKLTDGRTVTCSQNQEQPLVVEGPRPQITLEDLEQGHFDWQPGENVPTKAGKGIRLLDMLREARFVGREKGLRSWGTRLFLLILTVLMALSVADFIALSQIDPEDFVTSHSQMLEVRLERGSEESDTIVVDIQMLYNQYKSLLASSGQEYYFVPHVSPKASFSGGVIQQTGELTITLHDFSYAPLALLDESSLLMGRMPENSLEIVVDRWVLDKMLEEDGVAQNGITGIDYFLGGQIHFEKKDFAPTIVGISDSGEPAIYMMNESYIGLASNSNVASLSSLKAACPGLYDDLQLQEGECAVIPENAGLKYYNLLNGQYMINTQSKLYIAKILGECDFYPDIVVADEQVEPILLSTSGQRFYIFCEDKAAMVEQLQGIALIMGNQLKVTVYDSYASAMHVYKEASSIRADARTIVTATVILLSMVMLFLLRRSQVLDRIGMLSVYRLLGIPKGKTAGIFFLESLISCLSVALPAAVVTWAVLQGLNAMPETQTQMLLPLQASLLVAGGITVYHLLVTAIPLWGLLRLPPAKLAGKFDF